MDRITNWIDELKTVDDVIHEMKKIGQNYISSPNIESRLLADWIYRFANKIEDLSKNT